MEITVLMPAYNAEKYIAEAIDSVLKQSFTNFEFIIVDDGSTDSTLSIIRSYSDKRIVLIENSHDYIASLNIGLKTAKGKYIARMDADDIMHIDRLRIQYSIMEEEPSITVCSSWARIFGEKIAQKQLVNSFSGIIEQPLLVLLRENIIAHPTVMIRSQFLKNNNLSYESYAYAEDYKLWTEIAKLGGTFFIESQPLLLYRISENQVTALKNQEQIITSNKIRYEIINYFISFSPEKVKLKRFLSEIQVLHNSNFMDVEDVSRFFYVLLSKNKKTLIWG